MPFFITRKETMGYYKKKLQEDMELHPESYNEDESEYLTEEELEKAMEENPDLYKKVNLKMDGSAVKESFEKEKKQ